MRLLISDQCQPLASFRTADRRRFKCQKSPLFPILSRLTPLLEVGPFEFLDEPFLTITRVLELSVGEDFKILSRVILTLHDRQDWMIASTALCIAS